MNAYSLAPAAIGLGVGFAFARWHFCAMGAISDALLFSSFARSRILALAAGLAALASLAFPTFEAAAAGPIALLASGLAFGIGMTLAGGCPLRLLARCAASDRAAALAVLAMAIATTAVAWLIGSPERIDGGSPPASWTIALLGASSIGFAMTGAEMRRLGDPPRRALLFAGLGIAAIVIAAPLESPPSWIASAPAALADAATGPGGLWNLGLPLGALIGARLALRSPRQPPAPSRAAASRALIGGLAMGASVPMMRSDAFSAILLGAPSFGFSTLALWLGLVGGVAIALRGLEAGSLGALAASLLGRRR